MILAILARASLFFLRIFRAIFAGTGSGFLGISPILFPLFGVDLFPVILLILTRTDFALVLVLLVSLARANLSLLGLTPILLPLFSLDLFPGNLWISAR